jgi:histone H3/H4
MADVLVVASKVKKYIKEKAGMNTSATTMDALTQVVVKACDQAIEHAKNDGRKTVMDRDFSA